MPHQLPKETVKSINALLKDGKKTKLFIEAVQLLLLKYSHDLHIESKELLHKKYKRFNDLSNQISEFPIAKSQIVEINKELPASQRYFLIRCRQFPEDNRHEHDPSNGYLGLQVDVQWPYKTLDAEDGVEERIRSHFQFPLAITR